MAESTLTEIAAELLERLETSSTRDRHRVIQDFFVTRLKQDEMALGSVKPGYYAALQGLVIDQVLPLYDRFTQKKEAILARRTRRGLWKYVLGTIVVVEVVEFILTKGRILSPGLFIPSIILEAILGTALYYLATKKDEWEIRYARSLFFEGVKGLDQKLVVDQQYDAFKESSGSDALALAEAVEIVSHYDRPDEFWRDYLKVRQADPMNRETQNQLGAPAFEPFLIRHINGVYNEVARQRRFDLLFCHAHQLFLERDPQYVMNFLENYAHGVGVSGAAGQSLSASLPPSATGLGSAPEDPVIHETHRSPAKQPIRHV